MAADLLLEAPLKAPGTFTCPISKEEFPALYYEEEGDVGCTFQALLNPKILYYAQHPKLEALAVFYLSIKARSMGSFR